MKAPPIKETGGQGQLILIILVIIGVTLIFIVLSEPRTVGTKKRGRGVGRRHLVRWLRRRLVLGGGGFSGGVIRPREEEASAAAAAILAVAVLRGIGKIWNLSLSNHGKESMA